MININKVNFKKRRGLFLADKISVLHLNNFPLFYYFNHLIELFNINLQRIILNVRLSILNWWVLKFSPSIVKNQEISESIQVMLMKKEMIRLNTRKFWSCTFPLPNLMPARKLPFSYFSVQNAPESSDFPSQSP